MVNSEQIKKEADVYLESSSMEEASKRIGVSTRTLQLHLKKLLEIDPDRYVLIQIKKLENENIGRVKGGTIGKRTPVWSNDEAQAIASIMAKNEYSYRMAEQETGIPRSTIHEMIHHTPVDPEISARLKIQADAHARHQSYTEYVDPHPTDNIYIEDKVTSREGRKK